MANTYDELYIPMCYYMAHVSGDDQGKAVPAAKGGKSGKKEVINKSSLIIEIKPSGEDTDLDEVLKSVKKINIEGLTWGTAHKKLPFAFGIFKLQVSCIIIDDLVNTDEIIEQIENIGLTEEQCEKKKDLKQKQTENEDYDDEEEIEGMVQSAEIISFNKL